MPAHQLYDHRGNAALRRDIHKLSYGLPLEERGRQLADDERDQAANAALLRSSTNADADTSAPAALIRRRLDEKLHELERLRELEKKLA